MARNKLPTTRTTKKAAESKEHTLLEVIPKGYKSFLEDLKGRIRSTQIKAAIKVNSTLIELYWQIGKDIANMQQNEGWGTQVIERLAKDLKKEFPGIQGFSRRNMFYMRKFAESYEDLAIVQRLVALIPWGHNLLLLQRLDDIERRLWYVAKTIENGWSRNALWHWIDSDLHSREGKAITNFKSTLPNPQSDLAHQTLKDPYCFDFLNLREKHDEKELEDGLVQHIQSFLLELGQGFAFMGRQYPITVDGNQYLIDLLFYHVKLRCYVVVELKARAFKPEDAGKLNFYLSAVDDMLKPPSDNPTIGILLCKTRSKVVAEYAFGSIKRPIGVVEYETMLTKAIPKELKSSLPTIEEIEAELGDKP